MSKRKEVNPVCPVTGQKLTYSGRGRPPVFASSVTQAQRRDYWTKLGVKHTGRAKAK